MQAQSSRIGKTSTFGNPSIPFVSAQVAAETIRAQELTLLRRARSGDQSSFEELLNRHTPVARSIVRRMLRHSADVEEVLQEAAWKAFRCADQFHGLSAFRTWYLQIVINEARQRLRSHRRRLTLPLESAPKSKLVNGEPSSFERLHSRQQQVELEAAVVQLPATYQVVIRLRLENKTAAQVARELDLTLPAVKTRYLRACRMLRDRLQHPHGGHRNGTASERSQ